MRDTGCLHVPQSALCYVYVVSRQQQTAESWTDGASRQRFCILHKKKKKTGGAKILWTELTHMLMQIVFHLPEFLNMWNIKRHDIKDRAKKNYFTLYFVFLVAGGV